MTHSGTPADTDELADDAPAPAHFLHGVRPFPHPGDLLTGLFALWQDPPQPDAPLTRDQVAAPWNPTDLPEAFRDELHLWLGRVVRHLNELHGWNPGHTIPTCWAHHPHLIAHLSTLAATRRAAYTSPQPQPASDWLLIALPAFYRELAADQLLTQCRRNAPP